MLEPSTSTTGRTDERATDEDSRDDLGCWFGLSYASWLTMPRVLMEAMPDEWQRKMARLLFEYDEAYPNQPDIGTRVQVTAGGKLTKTPDWLLNYRHPDRNQIDAMRERGEERLP